MATMALEKLDRSEIILALPRLAWLAVRLGFDRQVPWETKATLGAGLLYIISPIDGIPDFIPVIGWLEDLAICVVLIDGMVNHIDRDIVLRHWTGNIQTLDAIGKTTGRIMRLMPEFIRKRVMKKAFRNKPTPGMDESGRVIVDAPGA